MEDNMALETRYGTFLAAAGSQKEWLVVVVLLLLLLLCAVHRGIPLCKATALPQ
jgi:hypothetical protein